MNRHNGLFRYKRLYCGVASSPAVFLSIMDQVLQGVNGIVCYFDDILITGKNSKTHLQTLEEALKRLPKCGFKVNKLFKIRLFAQGTI